MKNRMEKRIADAKNEEANRNRNFEQAFVELNSRMVQLQTQLQAERQVFQDSNLLMQEEKRNFQIDIERKMASLRTHVESHNYQDCGDS